MTRFVPSDRSQPFLMPPDLREWVPQDDLCHFIIEAVERVDSTLLVIGRQLGHSQPQTTQRYAHLADDPVRKMTQDTGQVLSDALKRKSASPT